METMNSLIKIKSAHIFLNKSSEKTDDNRQIAEAVTRRYFVKTMSLKISQNSQENICGRVSFLMKLQA